MTTVRQPFEDVSQIGNRWFYKSHVGFFGVGTSAKMIRYVTSICWEASFTWSQIFGEIPTSEVGTFGACRILDVLCHFQEPSEALWDREIELFGFVKVDESWFFSIFWWFVFILNLQTNQAFCSFQISGSTHLMQPPNEVPWSFCRHLAGVTSVRSADGDDFAPQLMIWAVFPDSGWYPVWNSNGNLSGMVHPMTEFQRGPQCPPFQAIFGTGRWLRIAPRKARDVLRKLDLQGLDSHAQ